MCKSPKVITKKKGRRKRKGLSYIYIRTDPPPDHNPQQEADPMPERLRHKGRRREVAVTRVEHAHDLDGVGLDAAEHDVFLVAVPILDTLD